MEKRSLGNVVFSLSTIRVEKSVWEQVWNWGTRDTGCYNSPLNFSAFIYILFFLLLNFHIMIIKIALLPPQRLQLTIILVKVCLPSSRKWRLKIILYLGFVNVKLVTILSLYSITRRLNPYINHHQHFLSKNIGKRESRSWLAYTNMCIKTKKKICILLLFSILKFLIASL